MKRYVDLDEILLAFPKSAEIIIRDLPLADVAPVRHGRWELHNVIFDILKCTSCGNTINCNEFGEYYKKHWKFCPNCGAKMEMGE